MSAVWSCSAVGATKTWLGLELGLGLGLGFGFGLGKGLGLELGLEDRQDAGRRAERDGLGDLACREHVTRRDEQEAVRRRLG